MALALLATQVAVASLLAAPPLILAPGPHADADGAAAEQKRDQASAAEDDRRSAAKQAFDEGLAAVSEREFETAVSAFERAYGLRPHPVTLFNLALALEKAERLPEAWELFERVEKRIESDSERRDVRRHMRAIEEKIAIVEVDANPRRRLCIDGYDMPPGETSDFRLAVEPGEHDFVLDDHAFSVAFAAGDRRVLLLDDSDEIVEGRRRGRLMPAMLGVSIGTGALALGLGVASGVSLDPNLKTGLAIGAGISGGLALTSGLIALLVDRQVIPDLGGNARDRGAGCPGSPTMEQRLDRRLDDEISADGPTQLAYELELSMPVPAAAVAEAREQPAQPFPHPHGLQPPRRGAL